MRGFPPPIVKLTPREREIIQAILSAASNRVIADRLGISEQSVKNRLTSVYRKLGVGNRVGLVLAVAKGSIRAALIAVLVIAGGNSAVATQPTPALDEAIQQLRAGDAFRAVLILNDIVAQNPVDPRLVARAHAVRAMAYLTLNQPERAQAAVALARNADPSFVPSAQDVNPATIALFAAAGPGTSNPEADARFAEQSGNYQQAFLGYLTAYRALPVPAPRADDQRLRERIIRVVQRLPAAPVIPADAQAHARKAGQLLEAEAILGTTSGASSVTAAEELTKALRIAPWWPQATFQLATVQQRLSRVDDALMNLNLYKLADPDGYAKAAARTTPAPPAARNAVASAASVPPAGFGTVHVYRRYNYIGSASRADVSCDNLRMAALQNRRVVTFKVPAGRHTITVHKDTFELDVVPGAEYFFKTNPGAGWNTRPVLADEARKEIKDHNLKPNEPKHVTSTECRVVSPTP